MKTIIPPSPSPLVRAAWLALVCFFSCFSLQAQSTTGIIEGRVFNSLSGVYLEGARITVQGTALETFTDADGNYRLATSRAAPRK